MWTTGTTTCLLGLLTTASAYGPGWSGHHWPASGQGPACVNGSSCDFRVGQAVRTTSGLVTGHPASNATQVSEYLGIPFAKPPLGDLRFAPPQPYINEANISGAEFGYSCEQVTAAVPTSLPTTLYNVLCGLTGCGQQHSEDCLTLNVWSKPQSGSAKKPVMVWIYGGAFDMGGTNNTAYDGQYWADEEDVVLVSANYRLGIFGFPGSPTTQQNVALLDQRLAVEWVRDNIAAFGGDPERVIIFGESAGAASVDYYNYAWTQDPIIYGSIAQSGTANGFGNNPAEQQATRWYATAKQLGCGDNTTATPDEILACMRDPAKVTAQQLLNATTDPSQILASFGPTIDNKTVFANYTQQSIDGCFIRAPFLGGNNDNEAGLFELVALGSGTSQPQSYWDVFTQEIFTCPSNTQAWARWLHNVPVWRYRYFPSFPNIDIPTSIGRAYHGAEITPIFGTDQEASKGDSTNTERRVGAYTRGAWAAFAHCPSQGLTNSLGWPQYSPNANGTEGLVLIGMNNGTGATFSARGAYDGNCPLIYAGN